MISDKVLLTVCKMFPESCKRNNVVLMEQHLEDLGFYVTYKDLENIRVFMHVLNRPRISVPFTPRKIHI